MKHSTLIQSLAVLLAALLLLAAGGCTAASKPVAPPTQTEAPTESETPAVFEVRFELNGGTLESGKLLQYVAAGEDAIVPVAAREGYVLDGWDGDYENVAKARSPTTSTSRSSRAICPFPPPPAGRAGTLRAGSPP